MTPVAPVLVRFAGTRAAAGPLTLGQLNTVEWFNRIAQPYYATVKGTLDLPTGATLADVTDTVAVLLTRHEGLRTTYPDGGRAGQRVAATGVLALNRYEIGDDTDPADRASLVGELAARLDTDTSYEMTGLPVRIALATRSTAVHAGLIWCSHLAVDELAMTILEREFAEMVRDPAARRPGAPRHQPLDQAHVERCTHGRERTEAALSYWAQQLPRLPQCLYAAPARHAADRQSLAAELSSRAAAMALRHVAARTRTSRASIVFAALCALTARRTGYPRFVCTALSSNRFDRSLADYIGTLAQTSLVAIEVGDLGFDDLVRRSWAAVVQASRHGMYDVYQRVALTRRIERERGVALDFEPLVNSAVVEPPAAAGVPEPGPLSDIQAARSDTTLRVSVLGPAAYPAAVPTLARFDIIDIDEVMRLSLWSGDSTRLPAEDMKSMLAAVDRLVVAAAGADLDGKEIHRALDIEPIRREPDWLLVDSCWVDLAEVQRLLEEALAPNLTRVFPGVDGRTLVAYVVADGPVRSPEQAHARCVAALPGRPTAMAPQHYVLFTEAPADPTRPDAWPRRILAEGSGR
jgi:hypothetical protein